MTSGAPVAAHRRAEAVLAGLEQYRHDWFALSIDRWWSELIDGLAAVYPPDQADALALRLVELAATAYSQRSAELRRLDVQRTLEPEWFQEPAMLGYATYTDRFAGNLAGLGQRVGYLRELGVTYLHLMPLLLPRPGDNDGGYAVADYRRVRPDLGSMSELSELAGQLRANGISLVVDLVLNHVAAEHEWARSARAGDLYFREFFRIYPDRAEPDRYEATLPEVFPDFAPGSFTFDPELNGWVWTTFNSWQWDVNWANPDVFHAYAEIILYLANAGVEVLRLDAVAFLWKRVGTNCQNQPEVHALTQALRAVARIACPAVLFKAEAIVAPAELAHYLGQGEHHGKVSDLAYHNSLMVQIWSMLAAGDVRLAARALGNLPPIPSSTSWITYIRCHDDIGWAIDDGDAAAVGLGGFEHRAFLSDFYAGLFPGSYARGLVFQFNPDTGDRRISGTAASLAGLQAAAEVSARPDAADQAAGIREDALARLLLAHALIFGWGGIPVIWMGDELGLLNDPGWASEPGHSADNRWAHRPRMDWQMAARRGERHSVTGRLFHGLAHLGKVRAQLRQLHASVPAAIGTVHDPGVLPVVRRSSLGAMLQLYNVTGTWRPYPAYELWQVGLAHGYDAISGEPVGPGDDGNIWLEPYAVRWVVQS
jgi:amylosucrase